MILYTVKLPQVANPNDVVNRQLIINGVVHLVDPHDVELPYLMANEGQTYRLCLYDIDECGNKSIPTEETIFRIYNNKVIMIQGKLEIIQGVPVNPDIPDYGGPETI